MAFVDLCTAAAGTKLWRISSVNPVKGFYIPVDDLTSIQQTIINLQNPNLNPNITVVGIRIYNGLGAPSDMTTHQIYIVPVGLPPIVQEANPDGGFILNAGDVLCVNGPNGIGSAIYGPALTCQPFCSTAFNPLNFSDFNCLDFPCPPPNLTPHEKRSGAILTTIPPATVCDAAHATKRWRDLNENYPLAFLIPLDDFDAIMGTVAADNSIVGIRLYNALAALQNPKTHHLYIVPVGPQTIQVIQNGATVINGADILCINGQSVIYDTTAPCPPICSLSNPLNDDKDARNCVQFECQL